MYASKEDKSKKKMEKKMEKKEQKNTLKNTLTTLSSGERKWIAREYKGKRVRRGFMGFALGVIVGFALYYLIHLIFPNLPI